GAELVDGDGGIGHESLQRGDLAPRQDGVPGVAVVGVLQEQGGDRFDGFAEADAGDRHRFFPSTMSSSVSNSRERRSSISRRWQAHAAIANHIVAAAKRNHVTTVLGSSVFTGVPFGGALLFAGAVLLRAPTR